jgi:hypothetical protein
MSEMMVVPATGVECAAKIAMTALCAVAAAMGLLPIHQLPRFIFLERRRCEFVNPELSTPHRAVNETQSIRADVACCNDQTVDRPANGIIFAAAGSTWQESRAARRPGLTIGVVLWHTVPPPAIARKNRIVCRVSTCPHPSRLPLKP